MRKKVKKVKKTKTPTNTKPLREPRHLLAGKCCFFGPDCWKDWENWENWKNAPRHFHIQFVVCVGWESRRAARIKSNRFLLNKHTALLLRCRRAAGLAEHSWKVFTWNTTKKFVMSFGIPRQLREALVMETLINFKSVCLDVTCRRYHWDYSIILLLGLVVYAYYRLSGRLRILPKKWASAEKYTTTSLSRASTSA